MHAPRFYYVYIMTNRSKTLYTGVCRSLENRVFEHKNKTHPGFTATYQIDRVVYFERCGDIRAAIDREKQIKHDSNQGLAVNRGNRSDRGNES